MPSLVGSEMCIRDRANFIGGATMSGQRYGTKVYPVTRVMLETMAGSFNFMLVLIVTFYAGELIFKERQFKVAEVADALPVPNWVPLVAKSLALLGVIAGFMAGGVLAAMCFQLIKGGAPLEPMLYLQGALQNSAYFVLMG